METNTRLQICWAVVELCKRGSYPDPHQSPGMKTAWAPWYPTHPASTDSWQWSRCTGILRSLPSVAIYLTLMQDMHFPNAHPYLTWGRQGALKHSWVTIALGVSRCTLPFLWFDFLYLVCLALVYRKTTGVCLCVCVFFYLATLMKVLIWFKRYFCCHCCCCCVFRISCIVSCTISDLGFSFPYSICINFISFSCLIALRLQALF